MATFARGKRWSMSSILLSDFSSGGSFPTFGPPMFGKVRRGQPKLRLHNIRNLLFKQQPSYHLHPSAKPYIRYWTSWVRISSIQIHLNHLVLPATHCSDYISQSLSGTVAEPHPCTYSLNSTEAFQGLSLSGTNTVPRYHIALKMCLEARKYWCRDWAPPMPIDCGIPNCKRPKPYRGEYVSLNAQLSA